MTTGIKRFTTGERFTEFPGDSWNQIADFVEAPDEPQPFEDSDENAFGIISVKNVSATVMVPKGGIMQPTGSMLTLTNQADFTANFGPLLNVDVPDLSTGAEATYMIATHPIGPGLTGGGILSGSIWARVNVRNVTDNYAQAVDSDATKLESTASASRARIVAQETGTGEQWALILLAPYRLRIRKVIVNNTAGQSKIAAGGSGTVDVYVGGVNTGEENTVHLDWLHGSDPLTQDIDTDIRAVVADFEDDNKFSIIVADCNPVPAPAPPGDGNNITASTTQSQGNGVLNYRVNNVTVCANTNDTVTLISCDQGNDCIVANNGAQTLQVFPKSGDKIDGGAVDASVTQVAGETVKYHAVDNTQWIPVNDEGVDPHQATHNSGGSDPIKIDDLAAGDISGTDLDATATRHGLMASADKSTLTTNTSNISTNTTNIATNTTNISTNTTNVSTNTTNIAANTTAKTKSAPWWKFDSTDITDSDPGAGNFKFNHATPGSVTEMYISDTDGAGVDVTTILNAYKQDTQIRFYSVGDASKDMLYEIDGQVTDEGSYFKLEINSTVASSLFADNEDVYVTFHPPSITKQDITRITTNTTNIATNTTNIANIGPTSQTLSFASPITWAAGSSLDTAIVTLTAAGTLALVTGISAGDHLTLIVKQDAGGGNTLTFNSAYKFPDGSTPVLSTGGLDVDIISMVVESSSIIHCVKIPNSS